MADADNNISVEKLLEIAELLATPIDFDALVRQGILEKKGRRYRLLSMERLPEHARRKIISFSSDGTVRFSTSTKGAERFLKKIRG